MYWVVGVWGVISGWVLCVSAGLTRLDCPCSSLSIGDTVARSSEMVASCSASSFATSSISEVLPLSTSASSPSFCRTSVGSESFTSSTERSSSTTVSSFRVSTSELNGASLSSTTSSTVSPATSWPDSSALTTSAPLNISPTPIETDATPIDNFFSVYRLNLFAPCSVRTLWLFFPTIVSPL